MEHTLRIRGSGTVQVPAYGLADAEHQVEREMRDAWPGAAAEILDVARPGGPARIVEEFAVTYRVTGTLTVDADTPSAARREAFRRLRGRFDGTRFGSVRLEPADGEVPPA